jgi:hypothetical protein
VVFHASSFSRKNLGVDLCDCLYYFIDYLILILIARREKKIITCELLSKFSGYLNTFPNIF